MIQVSIADSLHVPEMHAGRATLLFGFAPSRTETESADTTFARMVELSRSGQSGGTLAPPSYTEPSFAPPAADGHRAQDGTSETVSRFESHDSLSGAPADKADRPRGDHVSADRKKAGESKRLPEHDRPTDKPRGDDDLAGAAEARWAGTSKKTSERPARDGGGQAEDPRGTERKIASRSSLPPEATPRERPETEKSDGKGGDGAVSGTNRAADAAEWQSAAGDESPVGEANESSDFDVGAVGPKDRSAGAAGVDASVVDAKKPTTPAHEAVSGRQGQEADQPSGAERSGRTAQHEAAPHKTAGEGTDSRNEEATIAWQETAGPEKAKGLLSEDRKPDGKTIADDSSPRSGGEESVREVIDPKGRARDSADSSRADLRPVDEQTAGTIEVRRRSESGAGGGGAEHDRNDRGPGKGDTAKRAERSAPDLQAGSADRPAAVGGATDGGGGSGEVRDGSLHVRVLDLSPGSRGTEGGPAAAGASWRHELGQSLRTTVPTDVVELARVVRRTAQSGEIRLVLKPEDLGRIRIRLDVSDGRIAGEIHVENTSIRRIVQENLPALERALAEAGLQANGLEVTVSGGDDQEAAADDGSGPRSDTPFGAFEESQVPLRDVVTDDTAISLYA